MVAETCIIGAGSSGIATAQVLNARGIEFDCFEKSSSVGGNWRYQNDNGMSAAYRSLHINTSRGLMAYRSYPMPETLADYPSHSEIVDYFDSYVDHFGFRERIVFRTSVDRVAPRPGGGWDLTITGPEGDSESRGYDSVIVANGHHWDPRWPDPPFPGSEAFGGEQIHSHSYETPEPFAGKRVVVLGIGNSACDIAVELSRIADRTILAMRRGAYIIPKYMFGKPSDETNTPGIARLPLPVQRALTSAALRVAQGRMTAFGLPEPDHKLLSAHPTVSSDLLPRIGHGDITVKPNLQSFGEQSVRFADGSEEEVDAVIYCTGYKISFPFFDPDLISAPDNNIPLYRRVVSPEHLGLYFVGLLQPLGAIMPLAEAQSHWVADVLENKVELPSASVMRRVIAREDERMAKRYLASKRHTIQVDFYPYLNTLARERRWRRRDAGRLAAVARSLTDHSHELRSAGA